MVRDTTPTLDDQNHGTCGISMPPEQAWSPGQEWSPERARVPRRSFTVTNTTKRRSTCKVILRLCSMPTSGR